MPGHLGDHSLDGSAVDDVAGECCGVDLIPRGQVTGDAVRLVVALGINDRDMHTLPRQRMADPLPEPAIAARHQRHRAPEVHEVSPACRRQFAT